MPKEKVLERFVGSAKMAFGPTLTGVYLHGSAAMGCFDPAVSDLDLLVVVSAPPTDQAKLDFMEQVISLNEEAPPKGIEMSVVTEEACRSEEYPLPFELHYSNAHRAWFQRDPADYIAKMKGADPDLSAHFMILYYRGRVLYGPPIHQIFRRPDAVSYLRSIEADVEDSAQNAQPDPVYTLLNLCRVLAFKEENLILSKKEGGEWLLEKPEWQMIHPLIRTALDAYAGGQPAAMQPEDVRQAAEKLLAAVRTSELVSYRSWLRSPEGIAYCLEDKVVRVRTNNALKQLLRSGKKEAYRFVAFLRERYEAQQGRPLEISEASLLAEIRIHVLCDRLFVFMARVFFWLPPLQKLLLWLHKHTAQIDCGERSIDNNRRIFDLLVFKR